MPSVAVDLAKQIFGSLNKKTVVLVGSGEMAEAVARLLRQAGAKMIVVGRTAARVGAEVVAAVLAAPPTDPVVVNVNVPNVAFDVPS